MINRLLYWLTASLPCRLIRVYDRIYMERYYLGAWFNREWCLHRFVSSDAERHLHDHLWKSGFSIVLSGGYDEEVVVEHSTRYLATETRRIRWFNRVNGPHTHRIVRVLPKTWTLFVHGTRKRPWWFYDEDGNLRRGPASKPGWWTTAPLGSQSGREPLERSDG